MARAKRRLLWPEASSRQPSWPCAHVASALWQSLDTPFVERTVRTLNVVTCRHMRACCETMCRLHQLDVVAHERHD